MSNGESESHILTSTWNIKYIKLLKLELNTNFKQLLYDKRIRFLLGTFKSNIGVDIFRIFVSFWFGALSVPSGNPSCTTSLQFLNHNRSWQAPASRSIYKKRQNNLFPFFNCSPSHNTCYWPQHRMPHLNWKVHPKKKWSQCFKILIITMCNCAKLRMLPIQLGTYGHNFFTVIQSALRSSKNAELILWPRVVRYWLVLLITLGMSITWVPFNVKAYEMSFRSLVCWYLTLQRVKSPKGALREATFIFCHLTLWHSPPPWRIFRQVEVIGGGVFLLANCHVLKEELLLHCFLAPKVRDKLSRQESPPGKESFPASWPSGRGHINLPQKRQKSGKNIWR